MTRNVTRNARKQDSSRGATLLEYAITLAILLPVFIVIGTLLQSASITRATLSQGTVANSAPCAPASIAVPSGEFLSRDSTSDDCM
jgi:hypothetical protein